METKTEHIIDFENNPQEIINDFIQGKMTYLECHRKLLDVCDLQALLHWSAQLVWCGHLKTTDPVGAMMHCTRELTIDNIQHLIMLRRGIGDTLALLRENLESLERANIQLLDFYENLKKVI